MEKPRWKIESLQDIERAINVLHRRSMRDKTEIDILVAKVDLLCTPRWKWRKRRLTKKWITVLATEREETDG